MSLWRVRFFQSIPSRPEVKMTQTPACVAVPPWAKRKTAVIIMAREVGNMPKNRPDTPSSTERVSKTMPGTYCQGELMRTMPNRPRVMPTKTCTASRCLKRQRLVVTS